MPPSGGRENKELPVKAPILTAQDSRSFLQFLATAPMVLGADPTVGALLQASHGVPKSQGSGWGQLGHMALSKSLPPWVRKVPVLGCNDLPTCSQAPGQERPGCYLLPGPLCAPTDFQKGVDQFPGGIPRK